MKIKEVDIEGLCFNPMTMIGGGWWLIGAGNEKAGYNAMTASWGQLGAVWERPGGKAHVGLPAAVVYVRPQRYTKELLDREDILYPAGIWRRLQEGAAFQKMPNRINRIF